MDRLERLINLVIALRETRTPLATADIRERVAGYGQDDYEAFRRMFERDKADLRALGVPIETQALDPWGDRVGYRIDPERYDLPRIEFTANELAALSVAVEAAGLADRAGSGLRKLEVAAGQRLAGTPPPAVGVGLGAPHLEVLAEAQVARIPVRFAYRKPGEAAERRTVDPHALVHRRGRWYLVGDDHDRAARRAFRLDRIAGTVAFAGGPGAFEPADDAARVDAVVPETQPGEPQEAAVAAAPDVAWLVARAARGGGRARADGWTCYDVPVVDAERFVSWVLSFAPGVEVLTPAELRARVRTAAGALAGDGA